MKKTFKNKRVTIMGLGLLGGGVGVAKFFCSQGAKVLVTDLKTKKQLRESLQKLKGLSIKYILGRHRAEDFIATDLIIKNPGVPNNSPYLRIAREANTPIETDVSIFFDLCRGQIIGITGTKGKSTVATLIYKLLKNKYKDTLLAGNIGKTPLEILSKVTKNTKVVLELSSFELEYLTKSPKVAVITNIYPDHLNRYKNLKEYIEAKKQIFKYQKKKNILVLNYDNLQTRKLATSSYSRVYFYSAKKQARSFACFLKNKKVFFNGEKQSIFEISNLKLSGEHNISNILAAASVAKLFRISPKDIKNVLSVFGGVANRQDFVREVKGVKYFNDTTATMPEATIAAINNFRERFPGSKIILIAGGQDKNLNYKNLTKEIQKKIDCFILLPGTASEKIKKELKTLKVKTFFVKSIEKAVKKAKNLAQKRDIVLLSPGATSFNLFENEFDRGEQFVKFVKRL